MKTIAMLQFSLPLTQLKFRNFILNGNVLKIKFTFNITYYFISVNYLPGFLYHCQNTPCKSFCITFEYVEN